MKKILAISGIFAALCSAHARNHPPVLATIGNKTVGAAQNLSFTISATDADGDSLTYGATGLPTGATFDPGARTFSWTPTTAQVGTFNNIVFSVRDGKKGDSKTISITVTNAPTSPSPAPNRPPVLGPIGNKTVQASTNLRFTFNATDPDIEPLDLDATGLPTGATFGHYTGTIAPGGVLIWTPTAPTFSWTPTSSQVGSQTVTFTVKDRRGGMASETITISVNAGASVTPGTGVSPAPATLSDFQYTLLDSRTVGSDGLAVDSVTLTLIFALTAPAATDVPVTLTVGPTVPGGFPPSVTIPAGTANYEVSLGAPDGTGTFTVTASAGGVSRTVTLILP